MEYTCYYCVAKNSIVEFDGRWLCKSCERVITAVGYETYCYLCDTLIPEDEGFTGSPYSERIFCDEECHSAFYFDD